MRKLIVILGLLMCFGISSAQGLPYDSGDDWVIYMDVPQKLKIKDKIILENQSPYTVLQAVVVVMLDDGTPSPIGKARIVRPGENCTMASFSDNKLKQLRGRTIALKVKAVKKELGDTHSAGVFAGDFGLGVSSYELNADELNNIDPELITYAFKAKLSERDHDLYITIDRDENVFDF